VRAVIGAAGLLSEHLARRADAGIDQASLSHRDVEAFLARLAHLQRAGTLTAGVRVRSLSLLAGFLRDCREMGLIQHGAVLAELPGDVVIRQAERPRPLPRDDEAGRALPETVMSQLLSPGSLERLARLAGSSEIRHCEFGCLSPATGRAAEAAQGEEIARFRYAQTKIDIAPDTILVDSEVVAVIEEQRRWVHDRFPGIQPRHLFLQLTGDRTGTKPYPSGTYTFRLREFSKIVQVADSKGRPVRLSHTHRFRHTKFTRLAELGLPVHVLQRYAGHYVGDLCQVDHVVVRYRRAAAAGERLSSWPISAQVWPWSRAA